VLVQANHQTLPVAGLLVGAAESLVIGETLHCHDAMAPPVQPTG
jgi:hypothetical protein